MPLSVTGPYVFSICIHDCLCKSVRTMNPLSTVILCFICVVGIGYSRFVVDK